MAETSTEGQFSTATTGLLAAVLCVVSKPQIRLHKIQGEYFQIDNNDQIERFRSEYLFGARLAMNGEKI